jgi:hypothetical protein
MHILYLFVNLALSYDEFEHSKLFFSLEATQNDSKRYKAYYTSYDRMGLVAP